MENRQALRERLDEESAAIQPFLLAWWLTFRDQRVSIGDLYETVDFSGLPIASNSDLGRRHRLGRLVASWRDRPFTLTLGGRTFTVFVRADGARAGTGRWWLERKPTEKPTEKPTQKPTVDGVGPASAVRP